MEQNYSIEEILSAINEIQNKKKVDKNELNKTQSFKKDYSEVPKNTLKLIEEAEKTK
mgnify:CR=1 FL=1